MICYPERRRLKNYSWKHAILDSGVEIFLKGAKEYPNGFFDKYAFTCQQYTEIFGDRLWCVIPDYPDDYRNNPIEHNVRKTLRNIKRFHKVKGVNWVYPLQSDYLNLQNFHDSCHQVMKYCPERIAIGTVCKTRNLQFIEKACRMAHQHFPVSHIHAFGPTLSALPRILPFIDSWDSCAYFYNENATLCKTAEERKLAFERYVEKINKILVNYHSQIRLDKFLEPAS